MIEWVSDDDLNSLDEVVAGISKYIEPAVGAQIIADIRAELLALRKVADAAAVYARNYGVTVSEHKSCGTCAALDMANALKDAGR